jgi:hypothetical protein
VYNWQGAPLQAYRRSDGVAPASFDALMPDTVCIWLLQTRPRPEPKKPCHCQVLLLPCASPRMLVCFSARFSHSAFAVHANKALTKRPDGIPINIRCGNTACDFMMTIPGNVGRFKCPRCSMEQVLPGSEEELKCKVIRSLPPR